MQPRMNLRDACLLAVLQLTSIDTFFLNKQILSRRASEFNVKRKKKKEEKFSREPSDYQTYYLTDSL